MLATLERLLERYRAPVAADFGDAGASLPPLHSGVVGYLGYDVVREVERLPDAPDRRPGLARRRAVGDR